MSTADAAADSVHDVESPFLRADHVGFDRVQKAFQSQLAAENDRVTLELRETKEALRRVVEHREELGVTVYGGQQKLAKLQAQMDELHDKFASAHMSRRNHEEKASRATADLQKKRVEVDQALYRVTHLQEEGNQLNMTLRQAEDYNEQLKAELRVTRQATYKAESQLRRIEGQQRKQDALIDDMNANFGRLAKHTALLDAQILAQRQETEAAAAALREAHRDMEAIAAEKKHLTRQWTSALAHVRHRDEAMQNVHTAMRDQEQELLQVDSELRGLFAAMRSEQDRNELLSMLGDRNEKETQRLNGQMAAIKEERESLMSQFALLRKTKDAHEQEIAGLRAQILEHGKQAETHERSMQAFSRDIGDLFSRIEDESSERIASERHASNSRKRIAKLHQEVRKKEGDIQSIMNELSRVRVDSLNTRANNSLLSGRLAQLTEDVSKHEQLITQCEQEVRRRHYQVEQKQLFVDRLNRDYGNKLRQLHSDLDEHHAGPQEAKLSHMQKEVRELTAACAQMQRTWLVRQTERLGICSELDRLQASLSDQRNKKMVLEQKKLRTSALLEGQRQEMRELEEETKALHLDVSRINDAFQRSERKAADVQGATEEVELGFQQKLKGIEAKCRRLERSMGRQRKSVGQLRAELVEAERQIMLWERKIDLEREMQQVLDPNMGQAEATAMKKEIHRMELRLDQLRRRQEHMITEVERAIHKRDMISLRCKSKAQVMVSKQPFSARDNRRRVGSLRNNIRLCNQTSSEVAKRIEETGARVARLQESIDHATEEHTRLETVAWRTRVEVQAMAVQKRRFEATTAEQKRARKRCEEVAAGTGPPPEAAVRVHHAEQAYLRGELAEIVRVLREMHGQLEPLWLEFHRWLGGGDVQ